MTRQPTHVYTFKPEFAGKVAAGVKTQTIRPERIRQPLEGAHISLRAWTGRPYRSKQRRLGEAIISHTAAVRISTEGIDLEGRRLSPAEEYRFALADGFNSAADLILWFQATHGLPFEGVLIRWVNL